MVNQQRGHQKGPTPRVGRANYTSMEENPTGEEVLAGMVAMEAPYVIRTPGGQVNADQIIRKAPLELAGRVFSTGLIILKGQELDVILGMS
jgi:hypothetical protein